MNRKTLIGMMAGSVLTAGVLVGSAQAGLFDSMMTSGWTDKEVNAKYNMEVYGFDVRVYEWIPADNPNVRMIFVAGKSSSGVGSYTVDPAFQVNVD
jgi:hypothetical protein